MSEPYFPAPQKKENAPYRAAAEVPLVAEARAPAIVHRPAELVVPRAAPNAMKPKTEEAPPESEPFLVRLAWRLAAKVVALAATVGILWGLVRAHELGEKWPQAVIIVLAVVGILAMPVLLYFRVRRLIRILFARGDDA